MLRPTVMLGQGFKPVQEKKGEMQVRGHPFYGERAAADYKKKAEQEKGHNDEATTFWKKKEKDARKGPPTLTKRGWIGHNKTK